MFVYEQRFFLKKLLKILFLCKHFQGNIRKVLLVFSLQAISPEESQTVFGWVGHSPAPRGGSPHPCKEAAPGLHALREGTASSIGCVKAFHLCGPGIPCLLNGPL